MAEFCPSLIVNTYFLTMASETNRAQEGPWGAFAASSDTVGPVGAVVKSISGLGLYESHTQKIPRGISTLS